MIEGINSIRLFDSHVALVGRGIIVESFLWTDLASTFNDFENVGIVGPRLLAPREIGLYSEDEGCTDTNGRRIRPSMCLASAELNFTCQVDYLPLHCLLVASEVWKNINWFEAIYDKGNCLAYALSNRVREMGYLCLYVPSIILNVVADEQSEKGKNRPIALTSEINRLKLKARWHIPKSNSSGAISSMSLDGLNNGISRALFIDFETPRPNINAGGYAAVKEMQVFQSLGYQVTFVPRIMENTVEYTDALQRMGIECVCAPSCLEISEFLISRGSEFSLIYITRYHVAKDVLPKIRQHAPSAKVVLMLADLHFLRELRVALHNKDDEQLSQAMETRENELAVMRKVDLVLSYSDVEKTVILSHNLASTKVAKCPWVCDVVESVSGYENRVDIAFLGGFNHSPNVEAMVWFIERVWPDLLEQLPEAQLRIYGSAIPQSIKDLAAAKARIQVHGWISDVASVYSTCRVFIAPLQSGAGIKGKVIGALAHGVPSVLSDIAVEGIGVCDEIHAFVASSPDEWVNRIMMLYTDQALWEQMSQHALSFAKRHYSLDNAIVEMKAALSTVGIEPILEPKALVWKGPWRSVAQV